MPKLSIGTKLIEVDGGGKPLLYDDYYGVPSLGEVVSITEYGDAVEMKCGDTYITLPISQRSKYFSANVYNQKNFNLYIVITDDEYNNYKMLIKIINYINNMVDNNKINSNSNFINDMYNLLLKK